MRTTLGAILVGGLSLFGCQGQSDSGKRTLDKLKTQEKEKVEKKRRDEEAATLAPLPTETVQLGTPWDDPSNVVIVPDGQCPAGLWALFNTDPPGADADEKKANKEKKPELSRALREQTFIVKLRSPDQVQLKPYDAPKGEFPLEVLGGIECTDSAGHIAIAWTAAKAGDPGNSAAKEDAEITQSMWLAPKIAFTVPVHTLAEAKAFDNKNRLGLSARVVFKLGKTEVDKKLKKIAKVVEKAYGETLKIGGGVEDWGAGRLVRAELIGLRVASDKEKTQLFEKRGGP